MRIGLVFLVVFLAKGVIGQSSCTDAINLASNCFEQFNYQDDGSTEGINYSDGGCEYNTGFPLDTDYDRAGFFRFTAENTFVSDVVVRHNGNDFFAFWVYEKESNFDNDLCLDDPDKGSPIACGELNGIQIVIDDVSFTAGRDYLVYVEFSIFETSNSTISFNLTGGTSGDCGDGGTLPITLKHFTARAQNDAVRLDWASYSESNNERYVVERSLDGEHFEVIGEVMGAGNSNQTLHYHLYDRSPEQGINYYRLKQIDFDGKFEYFDIRSVEFNTIDGHLQLQGNPVENELEFYINRKNHGEITIQLTDINGKLISQNKVTTTQKQTYQSIDVSSLNQGMYFLQLIVQGKVVDVEKVVVN